MWLWLTFSHYSGQFSNSTNTYQKIDLDTLVKDLRERDLFSQSIDEAEQEAAMEISLKTHGFFLLPYDDSEGKFLEDSVTVISSLVGNESMVTFQAR